MLAGSRRQRQGGKEDPHGRGSKSLGRINEYGDPMGRLSTAVLRQSFLESEAGFSAAEYPSGSESFTVTSFDGVRLPARVVFPQPGIVRKGGPFPTILMANSWFVASDMVRGVRAGLWRCGPRSTDCTYCVRVRRCRAAGQHTEILL